MKSLALSVVMATALAAAAPLALGRGHGAALGGHDVVAYFALPKGADAVPG